MTLACLQYWLKSSDLKKSGQLFEKRYSPLIVGEVAISQFIEEDVTILDGINAVLASQVINAWAAFETLATDLWEVSLNSRPMTLGRAVANRSGGDQGDKEKTIQLSILAKHGFDLGNVVGTILKKKYLFQKLEGIQDAYEHAFSKVLIRPQAERLQKLLSQKGMRCAAAVRNLLVHRGGVVDEEFKNQIKHRKEDDIVIDGVALTCSGDVVLEETAISKQLLLNGRTTSGLTNILVNCGLNLLGMADYVLSTNSE